ncbi:MAG: hypothetical protein FWD76_03115 [Firmicutes bacterium]|nr:hypothetical protein [Bacillota bacterium]
MPYSIKIVVDCKCCIAFSLRALIGQGKNDKCSLWNNRKCFPELREKIEKFFDENQDAIARIKKARDKVAAHIDVLPTIDLNGAHFDKIITGLNMLWFQK